MMKKILTILFSAATAIPVFAQISASGYYRIQNTTTGRYVTIVNNLVDQTNKESIKSAKGGNIFSLQTSKLTDEIVSDPGSVLYLEKIDGTESNIIAQDMNVQQLIGSSKYSGTKLRIYQDKASGDYLIYAELSGFSPQFMRETDNYEDISNVYFDSQKDMALWKVKPVDMTNEVFAVAPETKVGDKYYATMYCTFPFKVATGMKAYIAKGVAAGAGVTDPIVGLEEIASGEVPAKTPVILELISENKADNKLTPLLSTTQTVTGNLLTGQLFSYVRTFSNGKERGGDVAEQLKNVTVYDEATMRMPGDIGLTIAADAQLNITQSNKYLRANSAYLQLPASASATKSLRLVSYAEYQEIVAGISNISADKTPSKPGIYTLTGVRLSADSNTESLPNGIYIIDGKKTVVK